MQPPTALSINQCDCQLTPSRDTWHLQLTEHLIYYFYELYKPINHRRLQFKISMRRGIMAGNIFHRLLVNVEADLRF